MNIYSVLRPIAFATLMGVAALRAGQQPGPAGVVALTHAQVLDVATGALMRDATVVVRGGKIVSLGTEAPPTGAETIDVRGKVVMPGLIDAHAHIADLPGARTALLSGVTTARSAGVGMYADVALRELVKSGRLAGPDILAAGVHIQPNFENNNDVLSDPRMFEFLDGIRTADQARRATQVNLDHNVDVIKTSATDRAGTADTDPRHFLLDEAELRAVVETASARGIPVETHAHGDEGAANAVRAGVRSIEHGTYLSEATLTLMKEKGVWFVPTYSGVVDIGDVGGDYDDPRLEIRGRHMLPQLRFTIRQAVRIGVRFAAGADTEYSSRSVSRIAGEVAHLADAGLTPLAAIQAATSAAAELLGVEKSTGTVRPGLDADLLVVDANPVERVFVLEDPLLIMSNGRIVLNRLDPAARR